MNSPAMTLPAIAEPSADLSPATLSRVVLDNNLAPLSPAQRLEYMVAVCKSLGLNIATKPFDFIELQGKLRMYAKKDATDQLRKIHGVSVRVVNRDRSDDMVIVTAQATDRTGRTDEAIGAVSTAGMRAEALANALMKAETKAKRRVTLSICGLGMLDDSEADDARAGDAIIAADSARMRSEALHAAADEALARGAKTVAAEVAPTLSLRGQALAQLDTLKTTAPRPQPWHVKAAELIPLADERTLDEFERGVLDVEQRAREEAGEPPLPLGDAELSAIRVFVWTRCRELAVLNKAAADYHKRQHGADYFAIDRAVRTAIAQEKEKPGSSAPAVQDAAARHATGQAAASSWAQTEAGKALAASEMGEGIVIVGAEPAGGNVG